jgi:steroid delta-isomerase-like uncharacterized protein
MTQWMKRYFEAWNGHDAEGVVAFMSADVVYEDIVMGVVHRGHDAIRSFAEETERFSDDYRFEIISEQASGDRYALEWEMTGTTRGDGPGTDSAPEPYRVRGVSVGKLDADGRIRENRDYWVLGTP